jgi:Ca2+-binding RTX toxin-like protein
MASWSVRARASVAASLAAVVGIVPVTGLLPAPASAAPVDQGFNLNPSDLRFILDQIKIAERHARTASPLNPCGTLLGPNPNQIPDGAQGEELPFGLRTVDGTCNNLLPGRSRWGAADQAFPRLLQPEFRDAETGDPDGPFGPAGPTATSYQQKNGTVIDSKPRVISNLIVDQTAANPAAVAAAGPDAQPDASGTLEMPNAAPDVGLSAPYNSMFTLFGQFFDHGLDLVTKNGGTVYMPLKQDDPLYRPGSPLNFMVLTRSVNGVGPDGEPGTADDREATNLTTSFVDQNQTYTSHPSHQVFVREYADNAAGKPMATGRLLEGPGDGMANWAGVKQQARDLLGIALTDTDVLNVPLLATDQYGRFERGPNGYPQIVTPGGLVEGNPASPISTANAVRTGHAFLDDIAHHAVPVGDADRDPGTPPTPLQPDSAAGTADDGNPGTYDDEMLDAHFIAGDGRANENIGLTAVHHVFHSEHNRLTGDIQRVLTEEDPAMLPQWKLADGSWNGERLFQAAKFVTEMEYQHLAFEEFARKVQPQVNVFSGYDTSVNPAIRAEFAHAVYRFGHSLLTETVARTNADGSRHDIALLDAFLNPQEFRQNGTLTADQAAGSIVRGMSRQVGQEVDEFVTEALRNKLLGLPLDLATINIARARETGVPSLNDARRQLYAATNNDASLEPYTSWSDFGLGLRNPESLVNFVAAYGTHPSITGTVAQRRTAAARIVANDSTDLATPVDSGQFLSGTGVWAGRETGLNDVDLWVGGLAEKQMPFGGLLGSTFNYVFETQMERLQDGDRFYYLSRTAGLNMLTQLEGNSFSELIMRNTDAGGLPADVFSRPDYVFDLAAIGTSGPLQDDPATDYNEANLLDDSGRRVLFRTADGTVRYSGDKHVVFNGTASADKVESSEGDDTVRGSNGDDRLEGGAGNDGMLGGLGDDIITDQFGDEDVKAGDGNDAINGGPGFDLLQAGRDGDFVVGGADPKETFGGPGDDFAIGGDSSDIVFGDDGDDWLEGGGQSDELIGDSGALFQDDLNAPGHDVLDGGGSADEYDAEGGDDIMLSGPGSERNEGMRGFDWVTHKNDTQPADSDMDFTGLLPPSVEANRDRFDLVEGLSGWRFDDTLRGDSGIPAVLGELEQPEDHQLTAAGIARVNGLADLLPAGTTTFSAGNIIIGGDGDDVLEGRGGDDVLDGDAWLNVLLSAPDTSTLDPGDRHLVDSMSALRADVFAGRINPGQIRIVRRVEHAAGGDLDVAVFSDLRVNYDCIIGDAGRAPCPTDLTQLAGQTVQVSHAGADGTAGTGADGTDTLRNVERLVFADSVPPGAPSIASVTGGNTRATVTWTEPTVGRRSVQGYRVKVIDTTDPATEALREAGPGATSLTVSPLTNGHVYRFQVQAWNSAGDSEFSTLSQRVTPAPEVPAAPRPVTATPGNTRATVDWTAPDNNGSDITGYRVRVLNAAGNQVGAVRSTSGDVTRLVVDGLVNGNTYWMQVWAVNGVGAGARTESRGVTPASVPGAPRIGTASPRDSAVLVRWSAPGSNGGAAVTAYRIRVLNGAGGQVGGLRTASPADRSRVVHGLVNGRAYRVQVAAENQAGVGRFSALSNWVRPGATQRIAAQRVAAPVLSSVSSGAAGGRLTATVRWAAPQGGTAAINGSRATALRMSGRAADARVLGRTVSGRLPARARSHTFTLRRGVYRFRVVALDTTGSRVPSRRSGAVAAR